MRGGCSRADLGGRSLVGGGHPRRRGAADVEVRRQRLVRILFLEPPPYIGRAGQHVDPGDRARQVAAVA